MGTATRLLLVEDEPDVRTWLHATLSRAGFEVVRACSTGAQALEAADEPGEIHLALVDLGLPDVHGLEVLRCLRERRSSTLSLVLTRFDDPETVLAALRAGARGYLLKHVAADALIGAVRELVVGGSPMTPRVARIVLDAWRDGPRPPVRPAGGFEPLTLRERDVLKLLATGRSYAQVGVELGIGLGTVQGYVKTIYGKLQVTSKAEAAALAVRLGWLPDA